ncbi:MAG: SGNH/GDSL hydrolase family protein [Planctomycetes bacterium]|nr:SGNH/GDSL hydrolase family protein [Planctomycetota bacterium]
MAPRARRKFLFAILTNATLILLAEGAGRLIAPAATKPATPVEFVGNEMGGKFPSEYDPLLFWKIPAGGRIPESGEAMNTKGFRGPEFADRKTPGTKRILCIGDSNTFGIAVSVDETFAHRLQRWLSVRGSYEVINCGVPGYSSFQMLQLLKLRGAEWQPDVIILYAGAWNDYTPAVGLDDARAFEVTSRGASWLAKSAIFRFAAEQFTHNDPAAAAAKRKKYIEVWSNEIRRPEGARLEKQQFRETLERIADLAKSIHSALVVVIPPAPVATREKFTDGEVYASIVREVAAARTVPAADARAAMWRPETGPRDLFADIIHPAPLGHAIITKLLAESLIQLQAAPAAPAPPEAILAEPLDFKKIQKTARHATGDPPKPMDAAAAAAVDSVTVALQIPHRIEFPNIKISGAASLVIQPAIFTRASLDPEELKDDPKVKKHVGPVEFNIYVIRASGEKIRVLRASHECENTKIWSDTWPARADLAAFGGENVTIAFEASGTAFGASWGVPKLWAFR